MCVSISVCVWVIYTHYLACILAVSLLLCYNSVLPPNATLGTPVWRHGWRELISAAAGGALVTPTSTPAIAHCPGPTKCMTTLDYTILRDCLYAYMHVHINMCKYQWKEFGGQPQVSCSLGPHRTIAASGRKSLLLFDYVITNGQYIHSECDRCLWPHIRGLNPLKNVSEHVSRFPQYH